MALRFSTPARRNPEFSEQVHFYLVHNSLVLRALGDNPSTVPKILSAAARIIGNRIRDARLGQGISMEDLSALSGMSVTSVGKIERGVQSPTAETLVRLAAALEIDAGKLLDGLGPADFGEREHRYTAKDFLKERHERGKRA